MSHARSIARPRLNPGIALGVAGAVAFAPLLAGAPVHPATISRPHISAPAVTLTAVINPADIDALIANLNGALDSAGSTVAGIVGIPGQTLASALNTAAGLNNSLWDQLTSATTNPVLRQVLTALQKSSNGGLTSLAATVTDANTPLTLTTGQIADLLSSVLTGSLSTALHAVTNLLNNPLSVSSYTGLLDVPVNVLGLAVTNGLKALGDLSKNGLSLVSTLTTAVTSQISNALAVFNGLVDATKTAVPIDLFDGALTAVQGIVSAPVTAAVALIGGGVPAIAGALGNTLSRVADGAAQVAGTWLGDGTHSGALLNVLHTVGSAPLDPASYVRALSVLAGAGATTGLQLFHTAASLAAVPVVLTSGFVRTGADVVTKLASSAAQVVSGLMQMAGLPPYVRHLPYAMATVFNAAVNTAATLTVAGLNTIATALGVATSIVGTVTGTNAAAATSPVKVQALAAAATTSTTGEPTTSKSATAKPAAELGAGAATGKTGDAGKAAVTAAAATAGTAETKTETKAETKTEAKAETKAETKAELSSTTTKPAASSTAESAAATGAQAAGGTKSVKGASTPASEGSSGTGQGRGSDSAAAGKGASTGISRATSTTGGSGKADGAPKPSGQPKHAAGASDTGSSVSSITSRLGHQAPSAKSDTGAGKHAKGAA